MLDRIILYVGILVAFIVICWVSVTFAHAHQYHQFKFMVQQDFERIVESRGHYVGFFGQCPYQKDDHYYLPCRDLLTPQQLADLTEGLPKR